MKSAIAPDFKCGIETAIISISIFGFFNALLISIARIENVLLAYNFSPSISIRGESSRTTTLYNLLASSHFRNLVYGSSSDK
jgi:hypothetical protein